MKKLLFGAVACACLAGFAQAETQKVNSTAHWVQMNPGNPVEMPNGAKGTAGMQAHATVVSADGELMSQWCTAQQGVGPDGQARGAGYCTIIADNGDILWVSFVNRGPDQPGTWTVMGGTGEYDGATGGGTPTQVSARGDGRAWTNKSTGTIVTK